MDIVLNSIKKSFGSKVIFDNFSASFKKCRATCIMAPSGVGKTTLLRILAGLEQIEAGSIAGLFDERISMVFQEDRLCEELNCIRNISLVCPFLSSAEIKKNLTALELSDFSKPVSQLSGGMKRRVALIRALLAKSTVVLMDEPFKGLDVSLREKAIEYTKQMCLGKTLIIATHDINDASLLNADILRL